MAAGKKRKTSPSRNTQDARTAHTNRSPQAKKRRRKDILSAYAFLTPWIIGFLLFSGFPLLYVFTMSFTDATMLGGGEFVGFSNYTKMFQDSSFWNSLWVTLVFSIFSVLITIIWAFFLAMLLNAQKRFNGVFQFIYFLPAVVPSVALAFAFQMIFAKDTGIFNYLIGRATGLNFAPNWLYDETLVYPTVFFIMLFTYSTGQMMLIFRSGLKEVPRELYEAASLDGATAFQKFRNVTLPAISLILLFNMIMASIGALNGSFAVLYPLTGGGPNEATNVLSLYKEVFLNFRVGYDCCLVGWLDTLLPMIVPAFFAYPYNVFLFRQFFRSIPKDLDEAACIDGCGKMGVFLRILLPLSRPVFITIGILSAVFWWNELTQPLIYVNSDTWKPLTVALMTRFKFFGLGPNTTTWNVLMAVSTLMILPPILLYLCASRYLVEGIKTSGMKG